MRNIITKILTIISLLFATTHLFAGVECKDMLSGLKCDQIDPLSQTFTMCCSKTEVQPGGIPQLDQLTGSLKNYFDTKFPDDINHDNSEYCKALKADSPCTTLNQNDDDYKLCCGKGIGEDTSAKLQTSASLILDGREFHASQQCTNESFYEIETEKGSGTYKCANPSEVLAIMVKNNGKNFRKIAEAETDDGTDVMKGDDAAVQPE